MAWDLRRALLKKGEFESARLIDFEFRERARTMKLLAPRVSAALEPQALAGEIALGDDESILRRLLDRFDSVAPITPLPISVAVIPPWRQTDFPPA